MTGGERQEGRRRKAVGKAKGIKDSDNYTVLLLITVREGRESVGVVGYHVGDDWNNAQNLRN